MVAIVPCQYCCLAINATQQKTRFGRMGSHLLNATTKRDRIRPPEAPARPFLWVVIEPQSSAERCQHPPQLERRDRGDRVGGTVVDEQLLAVLNDLSLSRSSPWP
jgi:hypothetical protein